MVAARQAAMTALQQVPERARGTRGTRSTGEIENIAPELDAYWGWMRRREQGWEQVSGSEEGCAQ